MKRKIGLIIPIYNRAEYVKQCFDSLLKANWKEEYYQYVIVLINDNSTEPDIKPLIETFRQSLNHNINHIYSINNTVNMKIKGVMSLGFDICFSNNCEYIINLDSDAIVKANFFSRLITLADQHPNRIISGFNCEKESNPVVETGDGYVLKKYANGINMCFTPELFKKYIAPAMRTGSDWDYEASLLSIQDSCSFVIATPSVVQHIGYNSTAGNYPPDVACDFYQIELPNVTLFGIDAHNPAGLLKAAHISQMDIKFGAVNIITERLFSGREAYSEFCIKKLTNYFETSHVLLIHPDGYVLNFKAWDDDYLNYDYIGATWGYKDNMNVGNGGFTLRSKKLCDILATDTTIQHYHPEDHHICRTYRRYLESKYDIKFAPEEVANRFSIEAYGSAFEGANRYSGQFGFHSVHVDFSGSDIPDFKRYKQ